MVSFMLIFYQLIAPVDCVGRALAVVLESIVRLFVVRELTLNLH